MINDVICNRKSVRKYNSECVTEEILNTLQSNLDDYKCIQVQNQGEVRFQVLETDKESGLGFLFGLGKINAPYCIAGIVTRKEQELEVGFALEQQVLYLTEQGLGTCWLGTFDKKIMSKRCHLQKNEMICYIVAFGYSTQTGFMNNNFRKLAGSVKRKPFQEICLVKEHDVNDMVKECINMAILAPSANNIQPVRVLPESMNIHLYQKNDAYIDTGIFLSHCYLILEKYKAEGKLQNITITFDTQNKINDFKEVTCISYK